MSTQLKAFIKMVRAHIEAQLHAVLPDHKKPPSIIHQCMHYGVSGGGKRFRPVLVYATAKALNLKTEQVDSLAVAIELVHAYSLIHDDLPAMDNDKLRRGQPTCHILYGEANAILAGDALQALAFEVIANDTQLSDSLKVKLTSGLAHASGTNGMAGGQVLDLIAENSLIDLAQLQQIHQMKTGALIKACVTLTAEIAHVDYQTQTALAYYADAVGIGFQVQDDILDVTTSTEILGKTQGSDIARDKTTYVSLLGIEGAKAQAKQLEQQAKNALQDAKISSPEMTAIAEYAVTRSY